MKIQTVRSSLSAPTGRAYHHDLFLNGRYVGSMSMHTESQYKVLRGGVFPVRHKFSDEDGDPCSSEFFPTKKMALEALSKVLATK